MSEDITRLDLEQFNDLVNNLILKYEQGISKSEGEEKIKSKIEDLEENITFNEAVLSDYKSCDNLEDGRLVNGKINSKTNKLSVLEMTDKYYVFSTASALTKIFDIHPTTVRTWLKNKKEILNLKLYYIDL